MVISLFYFSNLDQCLDILAQTVSALNFLKPADDDISSIVFEEKLTGYLKEYTRSTYSNGIKRQAW